MKANYWKYFKYVAQHKWYVAIECIKMGMPIHAISHDLSKFLPSEFLPYAVKFYSGDYAYKYFEVQNNFEKAWLLHQHRNKHHWDYWINSTGVALPMPRKYVKQMIADWRAMGRKFGDTAKAYYLKSVPMNKLHSATRNEIDKILHTKTA